MTTAAEHAANFGRWLSAELAAHNLTAVALADDLGVRHRTAHRWTAGDFRPRPEHCQGIADFLGVEPDAVLSAAGYRHYSVSVEGSVRQEIVALIAKMPEELLIPLVPMLRGLADRRAAAAALKLLRERLEENPS